MDGDGIELGGHERALNPRVTVADVGGIVAGWQVRAAATRARRRHRTVAYGPHPREVMDIYPAESPRGTFVFIHGGYWRAFSQVETAWVADGFVDAGYTVALPTYPLCPEATLGEIIASTRAAFAHLWRHELGEAERRRVAVGGHSAGGHLTAALMATDWAARALPAAPFHAAVPVSGVFDLPPLLHTSMNDAIRLTPETAAAWSPVGWRPRVTVPMLMAVGGLEPAEFHRQSRMLAARWPEAAATVISVPDTNHFTVLDGLAWPGGALNAAVLDLLAG